MSKTSRSNPSYSGQNEPSGGAARSTPRNTAKTTPSVAQDARDAVSTAETSQPKTEIRPKSTTQLKAGLYLVATPIGNLGDLTFRARDVLAAAHVIACEDSRVTRRLTQAYGIDTPLISYHEHNAERVRPKIIERLKCGEAVALVSDAGTPLISDPGYKLVTAVIEAGQEVTTLPGASAALCALVLSGLPSDRFMFHGFLPSKSAARRTALSELAEIPASLIFYESPRRLADMLSDAQTVLGDRPAAVARELTKMFEELRRGSLSELTAHYKENGPPKGEAVVVIGSGDADAKTREIDLDGLLMAALETQTLRDAVADVVLKTALPKRQVYSRALALTSEKT